MLHLVVFDVGQAASAVLRLTRSEFAIIDCGLGRHVTRNPVLEYLRKAIAEDSKTSIRFLAISHLDLDHISGLEELLGDPAIASRIERVYCNDLEYRALWDAVQKRVIPGSGVTKHKA